jgi:hypothetical protein
MGSRGSAGSDVNLFVGVLVADGKIVCTSAAGDEVSNFGRERLGIELFDDIG